jgi:hypothetical protein
MSSDMHCTAPHPVARPPRSQKKAKKKNGQVAKQKGIKKKSGYTKKLKSRVQ